MSFFWTIVVMVVLLAIAWRFLGAYMVAVYEGRVHFLGFIERPIYKLLGTSPEREQTWKRYAGALIIFSAVSILLTYLIIRIQGSLPLNPQHLGAVSPALSWNTAVSFITNTNWQNYAGETTMSYFSQMAALTVQQFISAAVGHRRGGRADTGVRPQGIADDRQLLGGHGARLPVRPFPDRLRLRDRLRGRGRSTDPRRAGAHP